jgi:hypothetical protein
MSIWNAAYRIIPLAGAMLTCATAGAQPAPRQSPEVLLEKAKQVLAPTEGELNSPA